MDITIQFHLIRNDRWLDIFAFTNNALIQCLPHASYSSVVVTDDELFAGNAAETNELVILISDIAQTVAGNVIVVSRSNYYADLAVGLNAVKTAD